MKTTTQRSLWFLLAGVALLHMLGGCANPQLVRVHAWERATLADRLMQADRDPLALAGAQHVYTSRETAVGGGGVGGSGCGCN